MSASMWSAPVRYAEVDAQRVVFNSHYLLYCDEAMAVFCREHGVIDIAEHSRLVSSTQNWTSGATWGETVTIAVTCERVGRTSYTLHFEIDAAGRKCCVVDTTYVLCDEVGQPVALTDTQRAALYS